MNSKSKSKHFIKRPQKMAALGLMLSMFPTQMFSMPYNKANYGSMGLDGAAIANDPLLKGTAIFPDHDPSNKTLYVSPSSRKVQGGVFQIAATPACDILQESYMMTYMVPQPANEANWRKVAEEGVYSPYFDSRYGNYIRHGKTIEELRVLLAKVEDGRRKYPTQVKNYESAKIKLETARSNYKLADEAFETIPNRIDELIKSYRTIKEPSAIEATDKEIDRLQKEYDNNYANLVERLRKAEQEKADASIAFADANSEYLAVLPDEVAQKARIDELQTAFESINKLAQSSYTLSSKTLMELESAGVGYATASYSIWGDEEARMRQVVQSNGSSYGVARLPIYNVKLKPLIGHADPNTSPLSGLASELAPGINNGLTIALNGSPAGTTELATGTAPGLPVFNDATGQPVVPLTKTLEGSGAGTYRNLVTRGAFCTGDSKRSFYSVGASRDDGESNSKKFEIPVYYYKNRTTNILAQSVALEYDYNLKNDPTNVECTMDISKYRSYHSSKGTSGFLLWRKKWSNEERASAASSGVTCEVDSSEVGDGSTDTSPKSERLENIRQALMAEVTAEFVLTYAKSYELITPGQVEVADTSGLKNFGGAIQALCGLNIKCQVGAIVLKSADDLFGSARGSASGTDHVSGTITRRYTERTYRQMKGEAVIDLTVSL